MVNVQTSPFERLTPHLDVYGEGNQSRLEKTRCASSNVSFEPTSNHIPGTFQV